MVRLLSELVLPLAGEMKHFCQEERKTEKEEECPSHSMTALLAIMQEHLTPDTSQVSRLEMVAGQMLSS